MKGSTKLGYKVSRSTGLPLGNSPAAIAARNQMQAATQAIPVRSTESDEQIRLRLANRFDTLGVMTKATAKGFSNAMIVSGPAGLGKSHDVEATLKEHCAAGNYRIVKGYLTAAGLYATLYFNRDAGQVLVFDDADAIFGDETALNLLKAACDTTEKRMISWITSKAESEDSLPNEFEFKGAIVFITNHDFDAMIARGSRSAPHYEALMSRAHYLDMALHTKQDYVVRIKQVVEKGMLRKLELNQEESKVLVTFVEDNMEQMRELSLRMMVKLAGLFKMSKNWENIARITLMVAK